MWGRLTGTLAVALLLVGCASGSGSTTVSTTSTVPDLGLVWARIPHDEAVFGGPEDQWVNSVVAGGPGLVAAGRDLSGELDAVVWVSANGYTWSRIQSPAFQGPAQQGIEEVIAGGPGLVAVGYEAWHEAGWTSPDGYAWTAAVLDPYAGVGGPVHTTYPQKMNAVAQGGSGLVAAGYADRGLSTWSSEDGSHWSRWLGWLGRGGLDAEFRSVTVGGPGLVAGGVVPDMGSNRMDAAIWVKAEGQDWTPIDDEASFAGEGSQVVNCVTAGGPGLVAVGYSASGDHPGGAVWLSADGYTWSQISSESLTGGSLYSVVATQSGLVAVGYARSETGGDAAVWVSANGYTWTRVPDDEGVFGGAGDQFINSVAAGRPGLVAVGEDWSGGDADVAVWVATLPDS